MKTTEVEYRERDVARHEQELWDKQVVYMRLECLREAVKMHAKDGTFQSQDVLSIAQMMAEFVIKNR